MNAWPTDAAPAWSPSLVTGLVLAGGQGSRMGGVDKGLQPLGGLPLALHALRRLQPQVGQAMLNANRHLDVYQAMGVPVWPDAQGGYPGPLAGFAAGLQHCATPWLVTVPCDSPYFPVDLVARLGAALLAEGADLALAATAEDGQRQLQPVFCLMKQQLLDSVLACLRSGQRRIDRWAAQQRHAVVVFDEASAFANVNTLDELQRLQPR